MLKVFYVESLEARIKTWKKELHEWVVITIPINICLSLFFCFLCSYLLQTLIISDLDWLTRAGIMSFILVIPPLLISYPRKPTQSDVDFEVEFLTKCDIGEVILID